MIHEAKSLLDHILPMLPIIGAGVIGEDKLSTPSMISRILELSILGGIFLYTTVQVLDSRLHAIESVMDKREEQCETYRNDIELLKTSVAILNLRIDMKTPPRIGDVTNIVPK